MNDADEAAAIELLAAESCTIKSYRTITEGMEAQKAGSHPFYTFPPAPKTLVAEAENQLNYPSFLEKYSTYKDLYGAWGTWDTIPGDRTVKESLQMYETKALKQMVGVMLDKKEADSFRPLLGGHPKELAGDHPGVIVGKQGAGVMDTTHDGQYSLRFYSVQGVTFSFFSKSPLGDTTARNKHSHCKYTLNQLESRNQSEDSVKCPVPVGTFLYAPATWYHSTCHLYNNTVSLLTQSRSAHIESTSLSTGKEKGKAKGKEKGKAKGKESNEGDQEPLALEEA